jgi:hypothetical protein
MTCREKPSEAQGFNMKESERRDERLRNALIELGEYTRILIQEQNAREKVEEDLGACKAELTDRQILWQEALEKILSLEQGRRTTIHVEMVLARCKCWPVCTRKQGSRFLISRITSSIPQNFETHASNSSASRPRGRVPIRKRVHNQVGRRPMRAFKTRRSLQK